MTNKLKGGILFQAAQMAGKMPEPKKEANDGDLSEEDLILQRAMQQVDQKHAEADEPPVEESVEEQNDDEVIVEADEDEKEPEANPNTDDKGLFGNRQIEFVQDVYYLPKELGGDKSQPVGLLTQKDLNNYVAFRKGDRLTFRYLKGDAGACTYEAKRNGHENFQCDFDWSDGLIQELIDESAAKLAE